LQRTYIVALLACRNFGADKPTLLRATLQHLWQISRPLHKRAGELCGVWYAPKNQQPAPFGEAGFPPFLSLAPAESAAAAIPLPTYRGASHPPSRDAATRADGRAEGRCPVTRDGHTPGGGPAQPANDALLRELTERLSRLEGELAQARRARAALEPRDAGGAPPPEQVPEEVGTEEAARILGCSKDTVLKYRVCGLCPTGTSARRAAPGPSTASRWRP
jgi:hypothetical protein